MFRLLRIVMVILCFVVLLGAIAATSYNYGMQSQTERSVQIATPTNLPEDVYVALDARDQALINLYERVSPSVVHIISRSQSYSLFYGTTSREGTGSGFIFDTQGHIVTNYHVIENATEVDVLLADGKSAPAILVGADPYYDLAVLRVSDVSQPPLQLAASDTLQVGQSVVAIGNPFGLERTLTTGTISALGRRLETDAGALIGQAVQTDAAINPGNSGGPLLDMRGRVIGINTAINSPTGGSVGIGFAVPSNVVERVVPELIQTGRYAHPSLGVQVAELGTEITPGENTVSRGLLVTALEPGGAAYNAGLQAAQILRQRGRYFFNGGDIIVAIDGVKMLSRSDMLVFLDENYQPNDVVTLTIARSGNMIDVEVELGQIYYS